MPNNPGTRRVGATRRVASNKLNRGGVVDDKIAAGVGSNNNLAQVDASVSTGPAPSGSASGDLGGTYPNPDVVALRNKSISLTPPSRHGQVMKWNGFGLWWEPASPVAWMLDATDYGCNGDGTTNNDLPFVVALAACQKAARSIDRVVMRDYGNGYTGVPTAGFSGPPGSGAAGTALVSNVGANGKVGTVDVTNRGSGYIIVGHLCGATSGNPVMTCLDTTNISVSQNVHGPGIPVGTTVSAITPNVDVTLSLAPTISSPFGQFTFGMPFMSFSGGGGAGAKGDVIAGDGIVLIIPPGIYRTTLDVSLTGHHNLKIIGYGATLFVDGTNANGLVIDEFCRDVEIIGLKIMHRPTKFGNGVPRDSGCGARVAGDLITFRDCEVHNSPDFGILYTRDRTTGPMSYGGRIINCFVNQTCGDGIHASNSCGGLHIINPTIQGCGDDCIGLIADYGVGNEPQNIVVTGYNIRGGGFRGIAIQGAINVSIGPGIIQDVMGYGIELGIAVTALCQDISITGAHLKNIGAGGPGALYGTRHGIVIQNSTGVKVSSCFIDTCTGLGYYCDVVTDVQLDNIFPMNCASGDFLFGGGAKTRLSHMYRNAGALTYRGTAGTVTAVAPA